MFSRNASCTEEILQTLKKMWCRQLLLGQQGRLWLEFWILLKEAHAQQYVVRGRTLGW